MLTKRALVLALVTGLVFSQAGPAFAARSGGRAGGFRAPAPTRTMPRAGGGGAYGGGGYGGGYGGGFSFFPFLLFGGGGGGLFSLLIFFAIANFLFNTFRRIASEGSDGTGAGGGLTSTSNPTVTVAKVQVGLLAAARDLQKDLNRVAQTSDTSTNEGLSGLLQESVLALLRHPEYWAYGSTDGELTKLTQAETVFNRYALQERSKLAAETLSNYNGQVRTSEAKALGAGGALVEVQGDNEYIIVTLVIASKGKLSLPQIDSANDLRQALRQAGAISSDDLYGMELLWEPQAEGDVLSADEVMAEYPELRLVA